MHIFIIAVIMFNCFYDNECGQIGSKDFNIVVPDVRRCSKFCIDGGYSTVLVQTAVSNIANLNTEISNYTAIVNYRCKKIVIEGDLTERQQNLYQKLCENKLEHCRENKTGFESSWQSINKGERQVLNVDLHLPHTAEELRIRISKCSESFMVFRFTIDGQPINYNDNGAYKYNSDVFSTTELRQSPIKLSIDKYPDITIADVIFNIGKSKCIYGWHVDSANNLGYECFLNLDKRRVEGGYIALSCPTSDKQTDAPDGLTDVCRYYMSGSQKVCKDRCFNLADCSYLCAISHSDEKLIEGGYIVNWTNAILPDVIGSGRWKRTELPIDLVLFNECDYNANVCEFGDSYCIDQDVSFLCTNGTYNLENCIDAKAHYRYWRCPADEKAISMIMEKPGLLKKQNNSIFYKNEIMSTYRNKSHSLKSIKMLYNIMKDFSNNKTDDSFNLPAKEKRDFASFLLKKFVEGYPQFSQTLAATKGFEDESFYYSSVDIDHDKDEIDIEMSPEPTENNTEFIKLELYKINTRSNEKIRANYFQFKNMDIMDESKAVKTNLKNMKLIMDSRISQDDYEDDEEVLKKNSKMFTLNVEGDNVVKAIKYKLNMIDKIEAYSWLYQVENKCGFLDEDRNWTWSTKGCKLIQNGTDTYCQCNHLSNFALLIAMREVNKNHLKAFVILSIVGGVINAVSLFLFLIFVLFINSRDKLRIDQLNIAVCLLLGTLLFMLGSLFSRNDVLCSIAAMSTQFLFLAAFVWKLILGINVVRLIASLRYQNEDWLVKYRWIIFTAGYSVPLVIVAISGGLYWSKYGLVSENVCWIDASSKAFLSFLIPVCLIIGVNTIGLFFIANTLIRNYINTHKTRMSDSNELIVFVQLLVSMGLTWIPAYFAIAYVSAMYFFVLFFPMQGLLMFLLVVIVNKENREKVSSFIINNYNSITSKSTSVTDAQINSRSKFSGQSKGTESDNLLTGVDKSHDGREKSEDRLVTVEMGHGDGVVVTKC